MYEVILEGEDIFAEVFEKRTESSEIWGKNITLE